ncbi:UCH-domain-containing protein [Violaceomyces palustris]|uniref:UCH-domain-containing protein n=1 Tax=Violaceomyces palustris TaxID=1673888 RepID=A0ACD0NWH7_9BASI|nr:UCH-domain-containing protein [Violaceomyces palustris]
MDHPPSSDLPSSPRASDPSSGLSHHQRQTPNQGQDQHSSQDPVHFSSSSLPIPTSPSFPKGSSNRRPLPSPAASPSFLHNGSPFPPSLTARSSSYKRARTASPIIDDNSSDVDQVYSRPNSESDDNDNESLSTSLPCTADQQTPQPAPLTESSSSGRHLSTSQDKAMALASADGTIEGLMTAKNLRLDEPASSDPSQPAEHHRETLPSYADAEKDAVVRARPSAEEQLKAIRPLKNKALVAGETWYLLSRDWYKRWSTACAAQSTGEMASKSDEQDEELEVGPIKNYNLMEQGSSVDEARLSTGISEGIDYEILPEEGWLKISQWYGVDGPIFPRKVIEGLNPGQESIEFYPPRIRLFGIAGTQSVQSEAVTMSVSQTLDELKLAAKQLLGTPNLADNDIRFWRLPLEDDELDLLPSSLEEMIRGQDAELVEAGEDDTENYQTHATLKVLQLDEVEIALAIEQRQSGLWSLSPAPAPVIAPKNLFSQPAGDFFSGIQQPKRAMGPPEGILSKVSANALAAPSSDGMASGGRVTRSQAAMDRPAGRSYGLRGLNNLGNTCFMNSALQCMSNTLELQQYFAAGVYKQELNTSNPLGMGGAIAEAFGNLISMLWNGQSGSFWPREFKTALSRFAPQFSGYAQHDSQELLAFLLDGLHEDLNRIVKKPYIEAPDWEGGGEKEMISFAKKQWEIYKARNDSVIVDLFQGQYRSTLVCPECGKVSIKFDPFMYLTLPIPNKKKWRNKVYFVPYDPSKPLVTLDLQLPAGSNFGKLRQKVASIFGIDAKKVVGGEVWHHRVFRWFQDYEPIIDIKSNDYVYLWEIPTEFVGAKRISNRYRYSRSVADAEEDIALPQEENAVLPVFTNVLTNVGGSSRGFGNRRSKDESFGIPFFVSIPKSKMGDPESIRAIVGKQYERFSDKPVELSERLSGAAAKDSCLESEPSSVPVDWEIVDRTGENEIQAFSHPTDANVSTITEIREAGEAVDVPDQPSAAKPLPEAETDTRKRARQALFDIKFTVTDGGQPMPRGGNDNSESIAEGLEERHGRLALLALKCQAVTDARAEAPDPASRASSPRKEEDSMSKVKPLVYTGGALICDWTCDSQEEFLQEGKSGHTWGKYTDQVDEEIRKDAMDGTSKPKAISIEDCMDEFTKEEKLGEDDPWYCPSCKDFRQATKKFDLWKVPDILVVHLKRFSAGRNSRDKLNVNVDFPLEGLNLEDRVEGAKAVRRLSQEAGGDIPTELVQPGRDNDDAVAIDKPVYDLYAVDNHYGGLGSGHYTAYAKNPNDNKWYDFDDSSVRPVTNPESVKTASAYLLFYRRRTTRPIGGKSREKVQEARARSGSSTPLTNSGILGQAGQEPSMLGTTHIAGLQGEEQMESADSIDRHGLGHDDDDLLFPNVAGLTSSSSNNDTPTTSELSINEGGMTNHGAGEWDNVWPSNDNEDIPIGGQGQGRSIWSSLDSSPSPVGSPPRLRPSTLINRLNQEGKSGGDLEEAEEEEGEEEEEDDDDDYDDGSYPDSDMAAGGDASPRESLDDL